MPTIADYLKYANLQMAAEAFLKNPETNEEYYSGPNLITALVRGNHHASRFTNSEATKFEKDWIVLDQCKNTDTGFSGTLFRHKTTGELVLSIRSTEFIDDAIRDSASTNTLEVHATGWAWGQISDLETWYAQLKESGLIPAGSLLNVTGYSLGGHLATAFNLLHQSELNGGQVITFNGAGVGEIKSGTLADNLAYFNDLRTSETARETALDLQEQESIQYYNDLTQNLADGSWTAQDALTALQAVKTSLLTVRPDIVAQELQPLEKALADINTLQTEAARIQGFTSGAYGSTPDTPINNVPKERIEAQTLAYRLAVYLAGQRTEGANLLTDILHVTSKTIVNPPLANQFDLVGIESSGNMTWSAVANSQIHHGNDAGIFIEDQPFTRGGFTSGLAQGLLTGQIHLLQDKYSLNNFADTHSLVHIIDSLNIQNALLNLLPASQRHSTATQEAMQQIMLHASNLEADSQLGKQGQAEGDVLENLLNALGIQLLGPEDWETLRGDPDGNTWSELNDRGHADADGEWVRFNGRESFYDALDKLLDSDAYTALQDKLTLTPLTASDAADVRDAARGDFGAFAALYSLSPFRLAGPGLETTFGNAWGKLYTDWQEDKGLDPSKAHYSDDWYADRGDFLHYWLKGAEENKTVVQQDSNLGLNTTAQRVYKQLDSGQKVIVQNGPSGIGEPDPTEKDSQYYLFGGNGLDVEIGGDLDDHLHGLGGLDVLTGGKGDDCLEGGEGLDFYRFNTGDGQDTVFDTDGKAAIQRNEELLALGTKTGDGTWTGGTGNNVFTATQNGNDLILNFSDSADDQITLKNFDFDKAATAEGSHGLRLIPDLPARPEWNEMESRFRVAEAGIPFCFIQAYCLLCQHSGRRRRFLSMNGWLHKYGRLHLQSCRQLEDVEQRNIALPALDATKIATRQTALQRQPLLRPAPGSSDLNQFQAKAFSRVEGHVFPSQRAATL